MHKVNRCVHLLYSNVHNLLVHKLRHTKALNALNTKYSDMNGTLCPLSKPLSKMDLSHKMSLYLFETGL